MTRTSVVSYRQEYAVMEAMPDHRLAATIGIAEVLQKETYLDALIRKPTGPYTPASTAAGTGWWWVRKWVTRRKHEASPSLDQVPVDTALTRVAQSCPDGGWAVRRFGVSPPATCTASRGKVMSKQGKVPEFKRESEERDFWEKHESSDYMDWSQAEHASFPKLKPSAITISLRLPEGVFDRIKIEACLAEDVNDSCRIG